MWTGNEVDDHYCWESGYGVMKTQVNQLKEEREFIRVISSPPMSAPPSSGGEFLTSHSPQLACSSAGNPSSPDHSKPWVLVCWLWETDCLLLGGRAIDVRHWPATTNLESVKTPAKENNNMPWGHMAYVKEMEPEPWSYCTRSPYSGDFS